MIACHGYHPQMTPMTQMKCLSPGKTADPADRHRQCNTPRCVCGSQAEAITCGTASVPIQVDPWSKDPSHLRSLHCMLRELPALCG
jgi:hypothetical protein